MNEYKKLKKALNEYLAVNEDLLQKAVDEGNYEETGKRERRVYAALKCSVILARAK